MAETDELLSFTKSLVLHVADSFQKSKISRQYTFDPDFTREIKADADKYLENEILNELKTSNLPILSEESGFIGSSSEVEQFFIVDPLDGTCNFVRGIGYYCISVALWKKNEPVFGVIYDLPNGKLYWGGGSIGAFCEQMPIQVSNIKTAAQGVIFTGFSVRNDIHDPQQIHNFYSLIKPFAKVRMLGSAALSLIMLSRGSAECYAENNIMLWDIAAGLAILSGSGGKFTLSGNENEWEYDVVASNGKIRL